MDNTESLIKHLKAISKARTAEELRKEAKIFLWLRDAFVTLALAKELRD